MRAIDVDALNRQILQECADSVYRRPSSYRDGLEMARTYAFALPITDLLTGTWIDGECSLCGYEQKYKTNFCPDCGARMKNGRTRCG